MLDNLATLWYNHYRKKKGDFYNGWYYILLLYKQ